MFEVFSTSSANKRIRLRSIVTFSDLYAFLYFFSIIICDFNEQKCITRGQYLRFKYTELLIRIYFSLKPMHLWKILMVLRHLLAVLHRVKICTARPYSEFFWSAFPRIRTEYKEILSFSRHFD